MASRRLLKKVINSQIADVIDQCYDEMIASPRSEDKLNSIIDESVELYDGLIGAVNDYRLAKNKTVYFSEIEEKLFFEVDALNEKIAKRS